MPLNPARWAKGVVIEAPGRPSPRVLDAIRRWLRPLVRLLHRPTLEGAEHLPPKGPFLLVANHSAGMGISEIGSFMALYLEKVGAERPLAGFAHPFAFRLFPLSAILRGIGAVPSTYEAAERALAQGVSLLVFPGGDHECMRPLWQAHEVDFNGRLGFLRIARAARVPIVPLGIRGGHFTAPVLLRSRLLATLLVSPRIAGTRRWGVSLLGVLGALAIVMGLHFSWPIRAILVWLWLGSPFSFFPFVPWTLRMRIGAPLESDDLFSSAEAASGEELSAAYEKVEAAVQSLVDR